MSAPSSPGVTTPNPLKDPRLAAIANPDGSINPAAVQALSGKHAEAMTPPELFALAALLENPKLVPDAITIEIPSMNAVYAALGGTVETETIRTEADGTRTRQRSRRRFRGREDVRRYRAQHERPANTTTRVESRHREHRPGSSRRTSSSSRTSSTDPGSDDPNESEPPAHGRQCAAPWCDRPVYGSAQKVFCGTERCDQARAAERQRKRRSGDLTTLERERLEDARCAGYVGQDAFAGARRLRSDGRVEFHGHALSFLWRFGLAEGDDPGEFEALLNRPACRCNGHHIDGGVVGCFKCGLVREEVAACS